MPRPTAATVRGCRAVARGRDAGRVDVVLHRIDEGEQVLRQQWPLADHGPLALAGQPEEGSAERVGDFQIG